MHKKKTKAERVKIAVKVGAFSKTQGPSPKPDLQKKTVSLEKNISNGGRVK
jgi:hypothetical protein